MSVLGLAGGLGGAIGGLAGMFGTKSGEGDLNQAIKIYGQLRTPGFDKSTLTPYELSIVGKYFPEVYEFVKPPSPETISEGGVGRDAQVAALGSLQQYQKEGIPLLDKLAAEKATQEIQRQNQRNQMYALEAMQQRGRAGGGGELAARMAGNQQSADLANQLGTGLQQQAIQGRLAGTLASANLGGQIQSQDQAREAQNAQIWNEWNKFLSLGLTDAAQAQAAAKNQAALYNLQSAQDIANQNTALQNQYQLYNQQNQNDLRQRQYQNELQKTSGLADLYKARSQRQDAAQSAASNTWGSVGQGVGSAIGGIADIFSKPSPTVAEMDAQGKLGGGSSYFPYGESTASSFFKR